MLPTREKLEAANLRASYLMFVDGEFDAGTGGARMTPNPATGTDLAEVATAGEADVDRAARTARKGYDRSWARMAGAERAKYLFRMARLLAQRSRELAVLEALDTGRPLRESLPLSDPGLPPSAAQFFHHAGWADKLNYAGFGTDPRPLGVAVVVAAGDLTLQTASRHIAPALACGNTVILVAPTSTPLASLVLAEIAEQADLPAGVLTVLVGGDDVGAMLVRHPGPARVTFIGPAGTGAQVQRELAGSGKRLSLELDSTTTSVVFDDAHPAAVVDALFDDGTTFRSGARILVQEPLAGTLLDAFTERLAEAVVGDPLDTATLIGPLESPARVQQVGELVEAAAAEGATPTPAACPVPPVGCYVTPTVISDVAPPMRIGRIPLAGPLIVVSPFHTPDDVITRVGRITDGRSSAVWTSSSALAAWTASRLRTGVVWVGAAGLLDPSAPYGGFRESGLGRVGGRIGLGDFLDV